ncbi:MAG TPA: hypothetical protein VH092_08340 [Urbifossiella sp.]|jgi:hypothetical protein|nr:hypothetical protein [Urbifossiella sp.]
MFRTEVFAIVVALVGIATAAGQPPPLPGPPPPPPPSPLDGTWYFRGNPAQPCQVKTIWTPTGPLLVLVNEKGTPAAGVLGRFAARVSVPEWGVVGSVRPNALVWPNGDYWSR